MVKGFWKNLKKPFFALAPMANVTDAAFRKIIAKYGKPDVLWTEFVSADGLCSSGRKILFNDLKFSEEERPIVAQLFTGNPQKMREAASLINSMGFDGLDINMGCPDRAVEKQGAGAALMKNPKLAKEIIRAAKEAAPNLPISVKTRIGYNKDELEEWLSILLEEDLSAITIHARTRKEMSSVPARWGRVSEAVSLKNRLGKETLIIGNGDVLSLDDAKKKAEETGADGVMLGRAIFGNPHLFAKQKEELRIMNYELGKRKKLEVMVEHTKLFEKFFAGIKSFAVMKKHFKAYVSGFEGSKELRVKLMEANNREEVEKIISKHLP